MLNIPDANYLGNIDDILSRFLSLQNNKKTNISENEFIELINFYITNKELKKALIAFNYAIKIYPNSFDIKIAEAQILIESKLYIAAEKKLKILLKQKPDDLSLLLLFGINYSYSGLINKSIHYFNKSINIIPKKHQGDFMFNIAQTFINSGRFDIAIYYLVNAHHKKPNDDDIILDLAFCLERTAKYNKSEKLFKAYLKRNPFSKLAWYNLGTVLAKENKKNKAIEAFNFALALDPNFTPALINKADIFYHINNFEEAIDLLNSIIILEPDNPTILLQRAKNFFALKNYKNAISDLKRSLKLNNKNPQAWFLLSKIYSLFSLPHAKKALFFALKQNKIQAQYWYFAAKLLSRDKKYLLADKAFSKAISFQPFNQIYWFKYAQNKINQNQTKKAIFILKIAKDFISDYFTYYQLLSTYHLFAKDYQNSLKYYKKALKLNPSKAKNMLNTNIFRKNISIFYNI
jgi:tetratricopeptide (TPR) repeat protein